MSHILQNEVATLNTIVTLVSLCRNEMLSKIKHLEGLELPGLFSLEVFVLSFMF